MRFHITGADARTAKDVECDVEASDSEAAERWAGEHGVLLRRLTPRPGPGANSPASPPECRRMFSHRRLIAVLVLVAIVLTGLIASLAVLRVRLHSNAPPASGTSSAAMSKQPLSLQLVIVSAMVRTDLNAFLITIDKRNVSPDRKIQVRAWTESNQSNSVSPGATTRGTLELTDNSGDQYRTISVPGIRPASESITLSPGQHTQETLCFERPRPSATSFSLVLPGDNVDSETPVSFEIPIGFVQFRRVPAAETPHPQPESEVTAGAERSPWTPVPAPNIFAGPEPPVGHVRPMENPAPSIPAQNGEWIPRREWGVVTGTVVTDVPWNELPHGAPSGYIPSLDSRVAWAAQAAEPLLRRVLDKRATTAAQHDLADAQHRKLKSLAAALAKQVVIIDCIVDNIEDTGDGGYMVASHLGWSSDTVLTRMDRQTIQQANDLYDRELSRSEKWGGRNGTRQIQQLRDRADQWRQQTIKAVRIRADKRKPTQRVYLVTNDAAVAGWRAGEHHRVLAAIQTIGLSSTSSGYGYDPEAAYLRCAFRVKPLSLEGDLGTGAASEAVADVARRAQDDLAVATMLQKAGQTDAARQRYQKLIVRYPGTDEAQQATKALAELSAAVATSQPATLGPVR